MKTLNHHSHPGHDAMSIAIYDPQTRWLLTGDTIYPGLYTSEDGKAFSSSINRLYAFSQKNKVDYLMGNHIEMTQTKGVDYPTGTTYQRKNIPLPLPVGILLELSNVCKSNG
jgi:hypothetical protein